MSKKTRKILRFILAIVYALSFSLLGWVVLSLIGNELDFAGEAILYVLYLKFSLPILSLLIIYKAYRGWGMPARLMAPPPSSDVNLTVPRATG